ncbi:MAG: sigma-70 family RNA polymerase sigma factor [Alloprevotella sp.]|nr:sigma-70 family RNA polymerase sigma factor [Bacteroidales bacterium]MDY3943498.1 sigma-70 family RNA polymerase sigma factor [Alloprevotella sp.]
MKELDFRLDILPLKDKIFRMALRLTLAVDEAEDITQDVLLRLWEKRDTLTEIASLEAYATTMAKHLALDRMAKADNNHRSLDEADEATPDVSSLSPDDEMARNERATLVQTLLNTLPDKQRTALLLRDVEENSYAEIATQMGITEADVKVTIHRARTTLRNRILKLEGNGL